MIVFLDLEMSGLSVQDDRILEIGMIVTDDNLNWRGEFERVIKTPPTVLTSMNAWCRDTHGANGLVDDVKTKGEPLLNVDRDACDFLRDMGIPAGQALIAGLSVHVDKAFIDFYMPRLSEYLDYRILDVSTLRSLTRMWTKECPPTQVGLHRALPDCFETIEELRWYKERYWS